MPLLVSWFLPITISIYMVVFVKLVTDIRRDQLEYWKYLGSPSLSDPNGQIVILRKIIFGSDLPVYIANKYKIQLIFVRIFLFLSLVLFTAITAMIFVGIFDQ